MHNSGDEMELYAAVNKKFREIFSNQEQMRTFKTYDAVEVNQLCNAFWFSSFNDIWNGLKRLVMKVGAPTRLFTH